MQTNRHIWLVETVLPKNMLTIFFTGAILKNHIKVYQNQISQYKIQIINEPLSFLYQGIHKQLRQYFYRPFNATYRRLLAPLNGVQYTFYNNICRVSVRYGLSSFTLLHFYSIAVRYGGRLLRLVGRLYTYTNKFRPEGPSR